MINISTIVQLKAFARQDGLFLGLLWIVSFVCMMLLPNYPLGSFFAIATPFFVYWRLVNFRNYALDGIISFRRAFAYLCYTFMCGSLVFALAQYVYFRFLDGGTFMTMFVTEANALRPMYEANGVTTAQFNDSLKMMTDMSPIQIAFMFMMCNIMIGLFLSLPIALIGRRAEKSNN